MQHFINEKIILKDPENSEQKETILRNNNCFYMVKIYSPLSPILGI